MGTYEPIPEAHVEESPGELPESPQSMQARVQYAIYALALAASVSIWFIAIRAPLWLDETISFWQINGGVAKILSRQGGLSALAVPVYPYILWLASKILGTSEIALRIPSIVAMLGAVYLLYSAARELFNREVAAFTAIVFCIHPIVIFASIDVRPYAFAVLAVNLAIFLLVRSRQSNSIWLAALFGVSAAVIVYFHFLFAVILPAFAIVFFAFKVGDRKNLWRQFGAALAAFGMAFLPVIPGLWYMFRTSGIHVFDDPPNLMALGLTLAPGWLGYMICLAALAALSLRSDVKGCAASLRILLSALLVLVLLLIVYNATTRGQSIYVALPPWLVFILGSSALIATITGRSKTDLNNRCNRLGVLLCVSLAFIPILILYAVSVGTSIHIFVPRYRLVAIPGIALYWAFLISRIEPRVIRVLFCVVLVGTTAYQNFSSSRLSSPHGYTWKYALEAVERNASVDNAPVLICSDLPEADHTPMPLGSAKDSTLFAPLSYYKLSVPVVPLPRTLNQEAIRVGSGFLREAARRHERFLAIGFAPSHRTLRWLASNSSGTHDVRQLGMFDRIEVLEFTPRIRVEDPR